MALEMMGPRNEVVVPAALKKEKKRNSCPRGVISEILVSWGPSPKPSACTVVWNCSRGPGKKKQGGDQGLKGKRGQP